MVIEDFVYRLPPPELPPLSLIPNVLVDGLVIAIVAFSINISMASIFARKDNYKVDANQELLASVSLSYNIIPISSELF